MLLIKFCLLQILSFVKLQIVFENAFSYFIFDKMLVCCAILLQHW